jgi:hypothetical protein
MKISDWNPGDIVVDVEPWVSTNRVRLLRFIEGHPKTGIYNLAEELWEAEDAKTGLKRDGWFELGRWEVQSTRCSLHHE